MYYVGNIPFEYSDIRHYGILGMKWGIRRFQNPDGTLTEKGKKRYKYHEETLRQELGYMPNSRNKKNTVENDVVKQYGLAKMQRDINDELSKNASNRGKIERAHLYMQQSKTFSNEMEKLKDTANNFRLISSDEKEKINKWVSRKDWFRKPVAAINVDAISYVRMQNMENIIEEYYSKHRKQ